MNAEPKYKDVKFFLIFIAFASAFNYYLSYENIRLNGYLALTYTLDTLQGWAAWWAMRSIVIYLDRTMPYEQNLIKRITVQFLVTTFVGMLIITALTEICAFIIKGRSATLSFYTFDLFIVFIWFMVMNGIYIGMHFYHQWNASETSRHEDKKLKATGFYVKQGKQDLQLPFEEILGFYSEEGFTYVQTTSERTFLSDRSMDKVEQLIPAELFFRLNRKYILHRNAVIGFKRVGDGKLEINTRAAGNIPDWIPVSRLRAVPFKRWFQLEEN
ncbi:LytR/AlgR family response regulator transcription factor [Flavobacterium sp.]|uniref:LytR/AlgR family response regulator transcription factor n=1 Tax=Flavobacterium sp. TaxID=239 RepID=UPI0039E407FB